MAEDGRSGRWGGPPRTVLAVGHVTHDRVGGRIVAGGSALYAARAWRALGERARLVTVVGADFACDDALWGLDVRARRRGRTTVFTNVYPEGGARRQFVEVQAPPVRPGRLPRAWRRADVLFLAPVLGEVDAERWRRAVGARRVGLGLQGWLKQAGAAGAGARPVDPRPSAVDPGRFRGADAAFLSTEDLAGDEAWLRALAEVVPLVFLTRGAEGCDVLSGGAGRRVGVYPTVEIDPTGAGDTFAAATLTALARGVPPVEAARFGAAAASIIVEDVGAAAAARLGEAFERVARVGG